MPGTTFSVELPDPEIATTLTLTKTISGVTERFVTSFPRTLHHRPVTAAVNLQDHHEARDDVQQHPATTPDGPRPYKPQPPQFSPREGFWI